MNYELLLLFVGIALFAYWINYCMGTPLASNPNDVDIQAIFFFIPYTLAVRKLKQYHLWTEIKSQWVAELQLTHGARERNQARKNHMREVYVAGREFFTWEKSFLCPVCLQFWATFAIWALFIHDFLALSALYYLANHFLIRKIL